MEPNELTDELKEQARGCKTEEELADLAERSDMELSLDELDDAAGGRSGRKSNNPFGESPCKLFYGTVDPHNIPSRYDERCARVAPRVW